jgi:hypothetical protein
VKISTVAPLVVAITAIAQSAFAQVAPHQLVLTETSFNSLIVTYDGSTTGVDVNYISGDHWGVTIGFATGFSGSPQWTEPEDPSFFNVFTLSGINQFIVNSDFFSNGTVPLANGSSLTNFGTDTRDGAPISVTFNDRGDVAAVPDTGSTFALLGFSLIALLGGSRFRAFRLA